MAVDSVNKEGLTFGEWICAAGKAVFNFDVLIPYSTTETVTTFHEISYAEASADHRLVVGSRGPSYKHQYKNVYYSKQLREAWSNGEDPTEYRK